VRRYVYTNQISEVLLGLDYGAGGCRESGARVSYPTRLNMILSSY
jgi:hypothetical protein